MINIGLDIYITRYRNHNTINEEAEELLCARKFWRLLNAPFLHGESKSDGCICAPITGKEDIEELIEIAVSEPDYMGSYNSVPILCKIRDTIEEEIEEGWSYYLEADW